MRRAIVSTIFRKELIETLRDRRTIATMLLIPMVSYPLLVLLFSEAASAERENAEARTSQISIASQLPPAIEEALRAAPTLNLIALSDAGDLVDSSTSSPRPLAAARQALSAADLLIVPQGDATAALSTSSTARFTLYYDETSAHGPLALERIQRLLGRAGAEIRDRRLTDRAIDPSLINPIAYRIRSVATAGEVGGHLASLFLPMLILIFVSLAAFYPAIELTAGEKERGTLATLLTAPIDPSEIVLGKYLAVMTIGALAGLLNVSVIAATLARALVSAGDAPPLALPRPTLAMILGLPVAVLTVAALVASVLVLIASFGRSFRDGANLLSPVLLLLMTPAALAGLPSTGLDRGWALVPVAGLVLWLKAILIGHATLELSLRVIAASALTAGVCLSLAARVFADENARFGSEGRRADLRALLTSPPETGVPTALAFAAIIFTGDFFAGALFSALPPFAAVASSQVVVHVLPAWAAGRWLRAKTQLLPIVSPLVHWPRILGASFGVGLGAWLGLALPAAWLSAWIWPGAEGSARALGDTLALAEQPWPLLLLGFSLVPAIAEELVFRGVLYGLIADRHGSRAAIVVQAILFGLLHGSLFRFLPTASLGLLLGLLRARSGVLWPGILAHALSNAAVLLVERFAPQLATRLSGPSPIALLGVVVLAVAIGVLPRGLTGEKPRS